MLVLLFYLRSQCEAKVWTPRATPGVGKRPIYSSKIKRELDI
jgi:hypothetical protein